MNEMKNDVKNNFKSLHLTICSAENTRFRGEKIKALKAKSEKICQKRCQETKKCEGWTFVNAKSNCRLLYNIKSEKEDPQTISGYRNCTIISHPGGRQRRIGIALTPESMPSGKLQITSPNYPEMHPDYGFWYWDIVFPLGYMVHIPLPGIMNLYGMDRQTHIFDRYVFERLDTIWIDDCNGERLLTYISRSEYPGNLNSKTNCIRVNFLAKGGGSPPFLHEKGFKWQFEPLASTWIQPASTSQTNWGEWGKAECCPGRSHVKKIYFLLLRKQAGFDDDKAMGGLALQCNDEAETFLFSKYEPGGNTYTLYQFPELPTGTYYRAVKIRQEKDQGIGDDTAVNGLQFASTDGVEWLSKEKLYGWWGDWSDWAICPSGMGIAGLQTLVESCAPGEGWDWFDWSRVDCTALNQVKFYCRKV